LRSRNVLPPASEDIFGGQLQDPGATQGCGDFAKLRRRRICSGPQTGIRGNRIGEIGMVKEIEGFAAQHQALTFANLELARNTSVKGEEARPFQHIARGIAETAGGSVYKRAGVEPAGHASHGSAVRTASGAGIANLISSILFDPG